ncbi:hypothetical protein BDA99DRAFT_553924 [Phascolomyces articulosus]|uniref:Uncharacterized protein n=1 Tax=Phascolomyces articulosus TaxID=60185 RepID=A0AAD5KBT4_9FUNG|nr:hypothetical protein BDA99DRAFT_553924 [Phascolomyces articulosus]
MDALLLYTIRLALHHPTSNNKNKSSIISNLNEQEDKQQNCIPNSVFDSIKTWSLRPGDKVPKLQRDNLLSLLFHADEQWIDSIRQIHDPTNKEQDPHLLIDIVHRQQMIYLDTLMLLHKAIQQTPSIVPFSTNNNKTAVRQRLQEPILFAAQVLHDDKNNNHVRHLEQYTEELKPLADRVCLSLDMLRKVARQQALLSTRASILATTHLLHTRLDDFLRHWDLFESLLYQCYSRVVFGLPKEQDTTTTLIDLLTPSSSSITMKSMNDTAMENEQPIQFYRPLPQELFSDSFTRLLPTTLHRALSCGRILPSMIQDLDPIAFIAVPRLAVLSGMVYLHSISGWRQPSNESSYSVWFQSQAQAMCELKQYIIQLEQDMTTQQENRDYRAFVHHWTVLEDALVYGWDEQDERMHSLPTLYRNIYLCICHIADTLLADENARSFIVILRHLFGHFADTSHSATHTSSSSRIAPEKEESIHGVDEDIVLSLAI